MLCIHAPRTSNDGGEFIVSSEAIVCYLSNSKTGGRCLKGRWAVCANYYPQKNTTPFEDAHAE